MLLATLFLSPLFSDGMVLQRERANPLWGKDTPGQVVTLRVEGAKAAQAPAPVSVTTAADGTWRLAAPVLPAGGPYRLLLEGSTAKAIDDVLVGEVWLASGQSNMEWKLPNTDEGERAVAESTDPKLRMFTVAQVTAETPQSGLAGEWLSASPRNSGGFSAVAYHFARELRARLGVPVGILQSSWGGTRVEAWTSREALRAVYPVEQELATLAEQARDIDGIRAAHAARVAAWEAANFPADTGNEGEKAGWARNDDPDTGWSPLAMPAFWQNHGLRINGCVWLRRTVEIPAAWAGRELVLELGAVDDFDTTYFNGEPVGRTGRETPMAYSTPRSYRIPAALAKAGRALIAVRVFDQFGDGGFAGPASAMRIRPVDTQEGLPLDGGWLLRVERGVPLVSGAVYASSPVPPAILQRQNNPAALYNGMIAPLAGYGLRGAIWYQGESNVGVADRYRERLVAMIRDWRARWGQGDFDFLQVQLANYRATSDWPFLREAQSQVLAEPATGMALALDIGNPADIHPRNKREVGRRLSLLARRQAYGELSLEARGPVVRRVEIHAPLVRVHLDHARGLRLPAGQARLLGFEVAGADGIYHPAIARIEGETVLLNAPEVPEPRTVRHGWDSSPECNLQNEWGLPAEPFRTDSLPIPR
jgi:sialate O-acetylesterase